MFISIKTFYCQKEESTLILLNLPLFSIFLGTLGGSKFITQVQQEKVAKKNFVSDIVRINAAVNFYSNDYAMHVV